MKLKCLKCNYCGEAKDFPLCKIRLHKLCPKCNSYKLEEERKVKKK